MRQEIPTNDAHPIAFSLTAGVFAAVICVGSWAALAWSGAWVGAVAFGAVGLWMLHLRIQAHDERGWRIVETYEKVNEPRPAQQVILRSPGENWVYIESLIGEGGQYVYQPAAGRLAEFVRMAISPQSRIQFSQRQALDRGWTVEEYNAVVAQLKAVGWIGNAIQNGAPIFNQRAHEEITEWLSARNEFDPPPPRGD